MNDKMILVLKGLIKVYEDDMLIVNTFYKAFEYNLNVPEIGQILKAIETLRLEQ